ncbi:hypothetical protein D3C84_1033870 [compost metagenome]
MAHFHDREAFTMPVEQLGLGTQQDSFRQRSGTCAEVIGSFAHIHSRYAITVADRANTLPCYDLVSLAALLRQLRRLAGFQHRHPARHRHRVRHRQAQHPLRLPALRLRLPTVPEPAPARPAFRRWPV